MYTNYAAMSPISSKDGVGSLSHTNIQTGKHPLGLDREGETIIYFSTCIWLNAITTFQHRYMKSMTAYFWPKGQCDDEKVVFEHIQEGLPRTANLTMFVFCTSFQRKNPSMSHNHNNLQDANNTIKKTIFDKMPMCKTQTDCYFG